MAPPKFLPHNYSLVIHGIITPVMLLTTVCVASHCRNLRLHAYTVNCRSVEKCVLRTEVFYHYFSMQPRNMQCTQFFNGPAIDCSAQAKVLA